jgi:hypothetical protein
VSLRKCYDDVRRLDLIPNERLDSFDVVKAVDEYRNNWKPEVVKVVLLAESHKHTTDSDFDNRWCYPKTNPLYRGNYVRFVYCLANGESELVHNPTNKGTWQYWKLLFSCLNPILDTNDTVPVLRKSTKNFDQRMMKKISLLTSLKKAGVWLVDASIVGIAGEAKGIRSEVLQHCWRTHVGPTLEELNPKPRHVIVVGKGVNDTLGDEIDRVDPEHSVIMQPNAHVTGGYRDYPKCFHACAKFLN